MRVRNAALLLSGLVGLAGISAGPAMAGSATRPKVGQACATDPNTTVRTCFAGPTAIQDAIDSSGEGWTVDVGPGHFEEHLLVDHGISLRGQGDETVMDGVLDLANQFIIRADDPADHQFATPLRIEGFKFSVPSQSLVPDYAAIIFLKDMNAANNDVIFNNVFETQGVCRVIGVWSENTTATATVNNNTFRDLTNAMLLESQTQSTPAQVHLNRFIHLSELDHGVGSLGIEVFSGSGAAGTARQDLSGNDFDFQWAPAGSQNWGIYVDGDGNHIDIHADSDNFEQPTYGVFNANTGGTVVSADSDWWNCKNGPTGGCPQVSTTFGAVTVTNFTSHKINQHTGSL